MTGAQKDGAQKPLAGLKVVELGTLIAGPFCTRIMGATQRHPGRELPPWRAGKARAGLGHLEGR